MTNLAKLQRSKGETSKNIGHGGLSFERAAQTFAGPRGSQPEAKSAPCHPSKLTYSTATLPLTSTVEISVEIYPHQRHKWCPFTSGSTEEVRGLLLEGRQLHLNALPTLVVEKAHSAAEPVALRVRALCVRFYYAFVPLANKNGRSEASTYLTIQISGKSISKRGNTYYGNYLR